MKVLIIFGGRSTEHEVSCVSAASVLNNIKGHDVTKFGITKDGKWYHTEADNAAVSNGSWENDKSNREVFADFNSRSFVWDGGSITPTEILIRAILRDVSRRTAGKNGKRRRLNLR